MFVTNVKPSIKSDASLPFIGALRLHRNPQRNSSGDFAEGSFRFMQIFQAPLCNQSRPALQPLFAPHRDKRGSGGNRPFSILPGGFAPLSARESGFRKTYTRKSQRFVHPVRWPFDTRKQPPLCNSLSSRTNEESRLRLPAFFTFPQYFSPRMEENLLLIRYYGCRRPNFSSRCHHRRNLVLAPTP